jgi:hypothetical protein
MYTYGIVVDLTSKTDFFSVESVNKSTEKVTTVRNESNELYYLENKNEPKTSENMVKTASSAVVRFKRKPALQSKTTSSSIQSNFFESKLTNVDDSCSIDDTIIEKTNFYLDSRDLRRVYSQADAMNSGSNSSNRNLEDDERNFYFEIDFKNCMHHIRYPRL